MMRAIGQHIPYDSMVVIFGCCADKDVAGMLERITSGADKVIFTKVNNIRTADPERAGRPVRRAVRQDGPGRRRRWRTPWRSPTAR